MNIAEIGAGKVLSGLAKRVGPAVVAANAGTPEEAEALAAEFR
jgi:malonyl CoA-acyl carrier protein transacylase